MKESDTNKVRIPRLKIVSVSFGDDTPTPEPVAAGCPRCVHALSLRPDLSERVN